MNFAGADKTALAAGFPANTKKTFVCLTSGTVVSGYTCDEANIENCFHFDGCTLNGVGFGADLPESCSVHNGAVDGVLNFGEGCDLGQI